MKILCVEDDEGLAVLLQQALVKQHYQVDLATDGRTGWGLAEVDTYDLILLDWILPQLPGIEFCQRLRMELYDGSNPNRDTPVLLMTALDAVTHRVMGLNAGADDYVVKPFDIDELLARIRALLRRHQAVRTPLLQWGQVCLNPNSCEVTYREQRIGLAAKEYELLELFLRHPDQIFSLNRLLTALWQVDEMPSEGTVRSHIKGLRQKLKQAGADDPIATLYKLGYRLKPQQPSGNRDGNGDGDVQEDPGVGRDATNQTSLSPTSFPSSLLAPSPSLFLDSPELWEAWQEVRPSYCDRLSRIQQALMALQHQTLTPEQQTIAEREAHTLVGSLGSFGLESASQISRHIQQTFQQSVPLGQSDIETLLPLVAALWQQLKHPADEPLTAIEPLETLTLPPAPLLLIVENDLTWAQELAQEASSWGWQTAISTHLNTATAQQLLQNGAVSTILLGLDWSDTGEMGLEFLATIRRQYSQLPVVTLTNEVSWERRLTLAQMGTQCHLHKPIAPAQIFPAIASLLPSPHQPPARIMLMDNDPIVLQSLNTLLASEGYHVTCLREPDQFWQLLEQTKPDLLIVEVDLGSLSSVTVTCAQVTHPPFTGVDLCQAIRSDPAWYRLSVIVLADQTSRETVHSCFTAGADDVLSKPLSDQELLTRVRNRLAQQKRWEVVLNRRMKGNEVLIHPMLNSSLESATPGGSVGAIAHPPDPTPPLSRKTR